MSSPVADDPVEQHAARIRFRRAMTLLGMTLVIPGSAQLVAGNRRVAKIAMRTWMVTVLVTIAGLLLAAVHRPFAYWIVASPDLLLMMRLFLMAYAVGWAALFVDAWRIGQPLTLLREHRLISVGLNATLIFALCGSLMFAAHLVSVQRDFLLTTFSNGPSTPAHDGRYNVLLMGGDSGAGRWGLRPDSLTVASIDADTGKTVLIGLPRNMANFPFRPGSVMDKQFPQGFDCEGCYLNGVNTWAMDHQDLFKGDHDRHSTPGIRATLSAVEGITNLQINYWAMVNLEGFKDLVDAVGGVKLHVRDRIPVGGLGDDVVGYIEPGFRVLNGHDTLWFARAREGSDDYSRMARQKCVMAAMLAQISPQKALLNFSKIAKASSAMISTDIPQDEVNRFIDLALKAKSQKIGSVSLVPPKIVTADPDIALIRSMIRTAITKSEEGKDKAHRKTGTMTGGSRGSLSGGYAANDTGDLSKAC